MKQSLFIAFAVALVGVAGCRSRSSSVPAAPAGSSYNTSSMTTKGDLVVVPVASTLVEMSKPDVSFKSNSVVISGFVRLRGAKFNPDAVVLMMVVDRHGNEAQQIRAVLRETDTSGTLSYRANFGPVPDKGSTVSLAYDDWHPTDNYSAAYIGSGGSGSSSAKGAISSGSGSKSTRTGGGSKRGK